MYRMLGLRHALIHVVGEGSDVEEGGVEFGEAEIDDI